MTTCNRGDIVLVRFVLAEDANAKPRPVLVISTDAYHQTRRQAIVLAITGHVGRFLPGNHQIRAWREAGLLAPAVVAGIIRTVNHDMLSRKLGVLPDAELAEVDVALSVMLGL
jgi:mRNA-degrading endonuclease toxin of MazEF toxin-antitoxin module